MKDVFGTEIELGDKVATNTRGYTYNLIVAEVVGFTPQKVRVAYEVEYYDKPIVITKFPYQLAVGVKNGITGQEKEEPR
jgi:hypothetical protein